MPRRRRGQEQLTRFEILLVVVMLLELAALFWIFNNAHPI